MTLARTIKLYKLADKPATPGLREVRAGDAPQIRALLNTYLQRFALAQVFSLEEVEHM